MKKLLLLSSILMTSTFVSGCATRLYNDQGVCVAAIYSNAVGLHYVKKGNDIALTADTLNNSTPTSAAFRGLNGTVAAAALGVAPFAPNANSTTVIGAPIVQGVNSVFRPQTISR
jgi:hypothetical protein